MAGWCRGPHDTARGGHGAGLMLLSFDRLWRQVFEMPHPPHSSPLISPHHPLITPHQVFEMPDVLCRPGMHAARLDEPEPGQQPTRAALPGPHQHTGAPRHQLTPICMHMHKRL